jgi:hypothetical protein
LTNARPLPVAIGNVLRVGEEAVWAMDGFAESFVRATGQQAFFISNFFENANHISDSKSLASSGELKNRNFLATNPVLDGSRLHFENLCDTGSVDDPSRINAIESTGLCPKSRLGGS